MKDIKTYMIEHLIEEADEARAKELTEKLNKNEEVVEENQVDEAAESIKDEKSFRDYAENKFKTVFGDKVDEEKMKKIIDGILDKYGKENDWGKCVGVLNKSFGK